MGLSNNLGKLSNMITSTGSAVGIGTASPADLLEVKGGNIRLSATVGVGPQFNLYSNGQTSNHVTLAQGFALSTDNIGYLYNRANADFVFGTNNTERLRIASTGAATFTGDIIYNNAGNQNAIITSGAANRGRMYLYDAGTAAIALQAGQDSYFLGGNFGIGTSSPSSLLHLSSTAGVSQTITTTGSGSYGAIGFFNTTTGYGYDIGFGGSATIAPNSFYIYGGSSASIKFIINSAGAVTIAGSLSKGSGSFRIDHPLESMTGTHQLVHSFIEGPQADLIYRGKLTLINGKAQANIDQVSTMTEGTFKALCREVQCFTTNESGWDLVKGKVIGNIIYIESQNENSTDEISWMVIGERKDKHMMDTEWTDDNGKVIVEPLKPIQTIVPEYKN
jgi:hypothetical protein